MATTVGTLNVILTANTIGLSKGLKRAGAHLAAFATKIKSFGLGAAMAAAPFLALGKKIASVTGGFELAIVSAGAKARATAEQLGLMRSEALKLAGATEFTAREVGGAMEQLAMKGLEVSEQFGAMPHVLDLASAAGVGLGDSASITAGVLRSQQLSTEELAHVVDVLAAVSTRTSLDVLGVGEALKHVGASAKLAGVPIEELVGLIGALTSKGLPAQMIGTGLKKMFSKLGTTTGKTGEILRELMITAVDESKGSLKSLIDILGQLERAAGIVGGEFSLSVKLMEAFGTRAGNVAAASVGLSDTLADLTSKLKGADGVAKDIATKRLNTFAGRMKILESIAERATITFGQHLTPVIDRLASAVAGAIGWFERLTPATRGMIAEVTAIGTVVMSLLGTLALLGVVLGPLGSALSAIGSLIFAAFSVPVAEAVIVIGGLITLAGVFKKAWTHDLGEIREAWHLFLSDIRLVVNTIVNEFPRLGSLFGVDKEDRIKTMVRDLYGLNSALKEVMAKEVIDQDDLKTIAVAQARLREMSIGLGISNDQEIGFLSTRLEKGLRLAVERAGLGRELLKEWQSIGKKEGSVQFGKDLTESLKEGGEAIKDAFMEGAGAIGDTIESALKAAIGEANFDKLTSALESAGQSLKDLWNSIKQGGGLSPSKGTMFPWQGPKVGGSAQKGEGSVTDISRIFGDFGHVIAIGVDEIGDAIESMVEGLNFGNVQLGEAFDAIGRNLLRRGDEGDFEGLLSGISGLQEVLQALLAGDIVGALFSFLEQSEQFQELLEFLSGILQMVADTVGTVLEPLRPLFGAIKALIAPILIPLQAVFRALGKVLRPFAPILMIISRMFSIITVILHPLIVWLEIFAELVKILVVEVLIRVFAVIGLIVVTVVKAIADAWNAIIGAIQWVFRQLGELPLVGELFDWVADGLESLKISTDGLSKAQDTLVKAISDPNGLYDSDMAAAEGMYEAGTAGTEAAEAVGQFSEELHNVPRGYKVALAQFGAMDPSTMPGLAAGGIVTRPTAAIVGEAGPEAVIPLGDLSGLGGIVIQQLTVITDDADRLFDEIQEVARHRTLYATGSAANTGTLFSDGRRRR